MLKRQGSWLQILSNECVIRQMPRCLQRGATAECCSPHPQTRHLFCHHLTTSSHACHASGCKPQCKCKFAQNDKCRAQPSPLQHDMVYARSNMCTHCASARELNLPMSTEPEPSMSLHYFFRTSPAHGRGECMESRSWESTVTCSVQK